MIVQLPQPARPVKPKGTAVNLKDPVGEGRCTCCICAAQSESIASSSSSAPSAASDSTALHTQQPHTQPLEKSSSLENVQSPLSMLAMRTFGSFPADGTARAARS